MGIKQATAGALLAIFAAAASLPAPAQEPAAPRAEAATANKAATYADNLYLAYIKNPSEEINNTSQSGLQVLASTLTVRTAVEPAGVAALNIERDELTFFPFIYWPVTGSETPLSAKAREKVQNYIDRGGLILFDIRDQGASLSSSTALRRLIGDIRIRALVPMDKEHTLTKTFYLVSSLPGSTNRGTVWVEAPENTDRENVSSVIIGNNNWAGAWAGRTLSAASPEREQALRAGINIVIFALTGNYKEDATHTPSILERLGKKRDVTTKSP